MRQWLLAVLAGCGGGGEPAAIDAPTADVAVDAGPPSPTTYRETCDGSGAIALTGSLFLDVNDENQSARIYEHGVASGPLQSIDLATALGVPTAEVDLEDLERVGDRMFAIASHGRKTSGALDRARYRFAGFDLAGTVPNLTLTSAGVSTQLLDQMLVAANWDQPNAAVIAALDAASDLGDASDPDLAPEIDGTNIEGLASDGAGRLLVGFRNPRPNNKAIVVSIVNPDAALTGTARFGGAAELDLGGLAIRSMTYSPAHGAVLIVAGPHIGGPPFKLYRWSGALADPPALVGNIAAPSQTAPEAIVAYPGSKDVQIVFDGGDVMVGNVQCKDLAPADRTFRDVSLTIP